MTDTPAKVPPQAARAALASRLTTAACVAVALAFVVPTLFACGRVGGALHCDATWNRLGGGDWRYFAEAWEAARVALRDFHQFPSWNPYHCGGLVLYQEPQTPFPSPLFLLTFAFLPVAVAYKVWLLVHLVAGALGARVLVRDRGGNAVEQVFGAVLVCMSGFWAHRMGGGHPSFTPLLYLPWLLWAQRRAVGARPDGPPADPRWAALVAGLLALTVYEGGAYPLPLMLVALAADGILRLGSAPERRALLVELVIVAVLFPLLAAVRLVPVLAYLREHPRLVPLDDAMTVAEVFESWLTRSHEWTVPGHKYVWPEYGNYIGLLPVLLLVAGATVAIVRRDADRRARLIDLAALALLIWCALGNIPGFSLFGLLHLLPIYESLRVPSRFLGAAIVPLALVVASALAAARRAAADASPGPRLRAALPFLEAALVLFVAVDLLRAAAPVLEQHDPVVERGPARAAFAQTGGADYPLLPSYPVRGIGTRQCYTPIEWKPAAGIVDGAGPQFRVEPVDAGSARQLRWTPNALTFAVDLARPATLVVNQNYETGWRASQGTVGAFRGPAARLWQPGDPRPPGPQAVGLLAVSLPAGHHELTVRHRPPGLWVGLALTALGIALSVAVGRGTVRLPPLRSWGGR